VDQRPAEDRCRLSLVGGGHEWFGPNWDGAEITGRARVTVWHTGAYADFLEWTFPTARGRMTRTALLLRGRDLALLAEQVEGPGEAAFSLALGRGVRTKEVEGSRAIQLQPTKGPAARVVPLGLTMTRGATGRGSCEVVAEDLRLQSVVEGRRAWLPLLVSWGVERHRKPVHWRPLTVTEKSKVCRDDVAVAWRVWWSQADSLVVYRSLSRHASRCFLGHQTKNGTRFFVAEFDSDGDMRPLLTV
jgi:hypothetical protein